MNLRNKLPFLLLWLVNSVFLYLATIYYPASFELGNISLSEVEAAAFAGFWLTALVWASKPFVEKLGIKLKRDRVQMFLFYWLSNSVAVWIVARVSAITGFGIARFTWAIGLGLVLNIVQWGTWQVCKAFGWVK